MSNLFKLKRPACLKEANIIHKELNGEDNQSRLEEQLIEEAAEVICEIQKYKRKRVSCVASEISDIIICIDAWLEDLSPLEQKAFQRIFNSKVLKYYGQMKEVKLRKQNVGK